MDPSQRMNEALSGSRRFWMMTAICIGAFLSHFTAGVIHVSLPHLSRILHADPGTVQWITTGYLIAITFLLPVMGRLGDRYGHRRVHNLGFAIFCAGSILISFSSHIAVLLVWRMIQAVGAAMFQATNIALITLHLPPNRRGQALGTVSTVVAIGGMSGPIAGGAIVEWLPWNWLFLIHVPVALLGTWLAYRFIPRHLHTRKSAPLLPVRALRMPAVASGLTVSFASFAMANTVMAVMPFHLSGLSGSTPTLTGTVMMAYPILLALTGPAAGHGSDRYGSPRFMLAGLCVMGTGMGLLAFGLERLPLAGLAAALAVTGLGMGLLASPNNSFIMRHAPIEQIGSIGGMIALTRNAGMAAGAALGLRGVSSGAGKEPASLEAAVKSTFQLNLLLCIGVILLLGYVILLEARRNGGGGRSGRACKAGMNSINHTIAAGKEESS